jgi:hypothetical protein
LSKKAGETKWLSMMTARQIKQVRNQLSEYVEEFAGGAWPE